MAEEDKRFEYIKDRIASAFPKLGNKLDKAITTDEARLVEVSSCNHGVLKITCAEKP